MATISPDAVAADRKIAPLVVIGPMRSAGHCSAWLEAAGRVCGKATDGHLCPRHRTVARRRFEAAVDKRRAELERAAAERNERRQRARARVEGNQAQLERVEAQLARLSAPVVQDRAAVGGAVHPSIARRTEAAFSPARTQKILALSTEAQKLRAEITLAQ